MRPKTSDKMPAVNINHVYWITTMLLSFVPLIIKSQTIKEKVENFSLQFVIQFKKRSFKVNHHTKKKFASLRESVYLEY